VLPLDPRYQVLLELSVPVKQVAKIGKSMPRSELADAHRQGIACAGLDLQLLCPEPTARGGCNDTEGEVLTSPDLE
jgi:hypothetical protein